MAHAADPRKHVHEDTFLGAVLSVWDWRRLFLGGVWRVGSARFLHACAQGHVLGGVIRVWDRLRLFLGGGWRVGSARFVHRETFQVCFIFGVSVDCFWVSFCAQCAEGHVLMGGGWRVGSARFVHRETFQVVFYFWGQRQLL